MASTPIQNPQHTDAATLLAQAASGRVPVAEPGVVLSYDAATQRAVIAPVLRSVHLTTEAPGYAYDRQAPIPDVPVCWPSSSFGAVVCDLAPGDMVLLVICGRSLDEWKATAESSIQQQDVRRHNLSDAIAFPMSVAALAVTQYAAGALVISGADVRLGASTATSPVALAVPTDSNNTVVWNALTAIATAADFTAAQLAIGILLGLHPAPTPTGATLVKAL